MSLDADDTEKGVLQDVDMSRSSCTTKQQLAKHYLVIINVITVTALVFANCHGNSLVSTEVSK